MPVVQATRRRSGVALVVAHAMSQASARTEYHNPQLRSSRIES